MRTMITSISLILITALLPCCHTDTGNAQKSTMTFTRETEPGEHSCTFLKPEGWILSGGLERKDTTIHGLSDKASEAVFRMEIISPDNDAGIFWSPEIHYFDMNRCPTREFLEDIFPAGSMYNGMKVLPIMAPEEYVTRVAIPAMHPGAEKIRVIESRDMEVVDKRYAEYIKELMSDNTFTHKSAVVTTEYTIHNTVYVEKTACTIEDYGQMGGGMWRNRNTFSMRSTKDNYLGNMAILGAISLSFCLDEDWVSRKVEKNQMFIKSNLNRKEDQQKIQLRIARLKHDNKLDFFNAMFSGFLKTEARPNPHINDQTVHKHNYWKYWWINAKGNLVCTNTKGYDPGKSYKMIH